MAGSPFPAAAVPKAETQTTATETIPAKSLTDSAKSAVRIGTAPDRQIVFSAHAFLKITVLPWRPVYPGCPNDPVVFVYRDGLNVAMVAAIFDAICRVRDTAMAWL